MIYWMHIMISRVGKHVTAQKTLDTPSWCVFFGTMQSVSPWSPQALFCYFRVTHQNGLSVLQILHGSL
jgi:hypothetical protein